MELHNQSDTPHFIKTSNYQQDHVRNSLDNSGMIRNTINHREYKSPGRTGYQAKYPTSFQGQNNYNLNQNVSPDRYSSPNYNPSPSKYASNTNLLNRMNHRNIKMEIGANSHQSSYPTQQYSSPTNQYSNHFSPSPYISSSYNNENYQQTQNNYNSQGNNYNSHNTLQQSSSHSHSRSSIQFEKINSQLKLSLQQSLSTQSALQDQLNKEKARSFELSEVKRKLEEELSKLEFQLDRITNIDLLGQRQLMVKYQAQVLQNQRLNSQLNDTIDELKRVKTQYRDIMSQNSKVLEEYELLRNNNAELLTQMDSLIQQVNSIKQECNQSALRERQLHLQNQNLLNSQYNKNVVSLNQNQFYLNEGQQIAHSSAHLNSIHTTRTDNYDSTRLNRYVTNSSPMINSQNDLKFKSPENYAASQAHLSSNFQPNNQNRQASQQLIDYDLENSKLVDDYKQLQMENDAMKKLYKQFYQQSPKKSHFQSPPSYQKSISQHSEQFQTTNSNFYNKNPDHFQQAQHMQQQMLLTFQKQELYSQISSLRQQVINQLMTKYFTHSLKQAQNKKVNVLVVFIKLMTKDIETIEKMVINYLQARDILKKQLNVKRLTQGQQGHPNTQFEVEAEGMWVNVKEKLKKQLKQHKKPHSDQIDQSQTATLNINAYYLALFRLLTLVRKYEAKQIEGPSKILDKIKHSALKYVHKIYEETSQFKQNQTKNHQGNNRHSSKVSLRK